MSRRQVRKSMRQAIAVVGIVAMLGPGLAIKAFALSYDDTNQYTTGCANGARTVTGPNSVDQGTLEEHFSDACNTAWVHFTCYQSGGCTNFVIWTQRIEDQYQTSFHETWPASLGYGHYQETNQLYDGPGYAVYVCFQEYFGEPAECNGVY